MDNAIKLTGALLGAGAILLGAYSAAFGLSWIGIETGGILKAKQVEVDREVFEQSEPFQRGQRDEFERLKYQYELTENAAVCSALKSKFRGSTEGLTDVQIKYINTLNCA